LTVKLRTITRVLSLEADGAVFQFRRESFAEETDEKD